jgi:hypothetical protein
MRLVQMIPLTKSWSDVRPALTYLEKSVQSSDTILTNCGTYRFKYQLLHQLDNIDAHFRNLDITQSPDVLKRASFVVWQETGHPALQPFKAVLTDHFESVLSGKQWFIGKDDHLPWGLHTGFESTVYRRKTEP